MAGGLTEIAAEWGVSEQGVCGWGGGGFFFYTGGGGGGGGGGEGGGGGV